MKWEQEEEVEAPDGSGFDDLNAMVRPFSKGAPKWCSAEDLFYARTLYGQAKDVKSLSTTCKAAQVRVRIWDKSCGEIREGHKE